MPRAFALATAVVLAAQAGCTPTRNYEEPGSPRFLVPASPRPDPSPGLKVVTFNVQFARRPDLAAAVLSGTPALRDADVVALQEMDGPGTEAIARALGMTSVYYPAAVHHRHGRDFGNALLARVPITADAKVLLPDPGRFHGMQRIAVAGTVNLEDGPVRVYSVHLGATSDIFSRARIRQVEAIVADARPWPRVVVAGDFNQRTSIGRAFEKAGYTWVTRDAGATVSWFSWDHVFARGLAPDAAPEWGVADPGGASDHHPVWAVLSTAPRTASTRAR
jgi:endonuclease/exonuclease/phosphatase family metal-dependent hydrolase